MIVRHDGESYEVTTFRTESGYSDKRHPDSVQFVRQIDEDLKRRDFTINALAMDKNGKLIDLFSGRKDLEKRLIRTVGAGEERFREDALRILRALRFSSQLGFAIEPDTLKAMEILKEDIVYLAVERMAAEMEKWAAGEHVDFSFDYLLSLGIEEQLPIFKNNSTLLSRFNRPLHAFPAFSCLIAYCHILQPEIPINDWTTAWKSSNKVRREALALVEAWKQYEQNGVDRWLVYRLDEALDESFRALIRNLEQEEPIAASDFASKRALLPIRSKNELVLKGEDIVSIYPKREKGRWIHELILKMERAVIEGKVNNSKIDLKEWIKWNPTATD